MTFQQQVNTIANIISAYNLYVETRNSGGHTYQDVRGFIDTRSVYIAINFTAKTIFWRDDFSKKSKEFRF
ncbi:MAG: hypothetical protein AAF378_22980 [Cyanobacteria bacterium P01_A01_bin.84]